MSASCSGGNVSQCMAAVGANSTFTQTSILLQGSMYAAAFIFILFVAYACYQGLGTDKVTYYGMFKAVITAVILSALVLLVVQAIVH